MHNSDGTQKREGEGLGKKIGQVILIFLLSKTDGKISDADATPTRGPEIPATNAESNSISKIIIFFTMNCILKLGSR